MHRSLVLLALPALVVGCNKKPAAPAADAVPAESLAGLAAKGATPPPAGAPAAAGGLAGKVLERTDAPPYSYLKLQTAQGEVWAAVPLSQAALGAQVTVMDPVRMEKFESKTLKRTFDVVYFGTLGGGQGDPHGGAMGSAAPTPHGASGPDTLDVKVDRAQGPDARTVAEVHAQKGALKERTVVVRGRVVKFNPEIMKKNWVHLRDGSGDAAAGTHDLTVTTQDKVAVGDVVTVKGTLRLDKDFGAGYKYPLIVEDAKVGK